MRGLTLILILLILAACSFGKREVNSGKREADKVLFHQYLETLKQLEIPLNLTKSLSADGAVYEYGDYTKFKTIWSDKPFGKLFLKDDKTVTVDLQVGSSYAPVLVVYDKVGHKLDSLYPMMKTDSGIDFEITEEVYINQDRDVLVICLSERWQLSSDSSRVEHTKIAIRDTVVYALDNSGRFYKVKN
ncbi:MAG: hypothetical protein EBR30_11605 [Cytophagia bacterium]|nr:hypothetical protein [Cytophagia bacterium]